MMQILQKALDWFKSLFWKVSFATTLIRVIANFIILIIIMLFNVRSAKGQCTNLCFTGGDGAHPGRTSGTKRILGGLIFIVLASVFVLNALNILNMDHLLDFFIINVHTSD